MEPTLLPTRDGDSAAPSFGCFEDWGRLSLAILRTCIEGQGGEFVLCPGTLFDVDEFPDPLVSPIVIHSSDVTVKCGDDGMRSNDCVVSGGVTQFKIGSMVMGIEFIGVTFEKSRGISIYAAATPDSSALFIDCEWRENEGTSAILLLESESDGKAVLESGRETRAMMVGLLRSNFTDNDVVDAAVVNSGGSLVVQETIFLRNRAADGAIAVLEGGGISVQNSCFVSNSGGAVTITDASTIEREEGNFGFDNGQCNGILDQDDDVAVMCGNACTSFSEDQCAVMDFDLDEAPSAAPTITVMPICVPTVSPLPSEIPTTTPTSEPTDFPTISFPPTNEPTGAPTTGPTVTPTALIQPTIEPTEESGEPTVSFQPTDEPTEAGNPTQEPAGGRPTGRPSESITDQPTVSSRPTNGGPTAKPSVEDTPTNDPTPSVTEPTATPTNDPTPAVAEPTDTPTNDPTPLVAEPTGSPSIQASESPSESRPTIRPTRLRSSMPTIAVSFTPSVEPSMSQTTEQPSLSEGPTGMDMSFSFDYNFFYNFD
jgi:hypothetical protein